MFKYGVHATVEYFHDNGYKSVKQCPTFYIHASSDEDALMKAYEVVMPHNVIRLIAHVHVTNLGYAD